MKTPLVQSPGCDHPRSFAHGLQTGPDVLYFFLEEPLLPGSPRLSLSLRSAVRVAGDVQEELHLVLADVAAAATLVRVAGLLVVGHVHAVHHVVLESHVAVRTLVSVQRGGWGGQAAAEHQALRHFGGLAGQVRGQGLNVRGQSLRHGGPRRFLRRSCHVGRQQRVEHGWLGRSVGRATPRPNAPVKAVLGRGGGGGGGGEGHRGSLAPHPSPARLSPTERQAVHGGKAEAAAVQPVVRGGGGGR